MNTTLWESDGLWFDQGSQAHQNIHRVLFTWCIKFGFAYPLLMNHFNNATHIYTKQLLLFPIWCWLLLITERFPPFLLFRCNGVGLVYLVSIVSSCMYHLAGTFSTLRFIVLLRYTKAQCLKCVTDFVTLVPLKLRWLSSICNTSRSSSTSAFCFICHLQTLSNTCSWWMGANPISPKCNVKPDPC